MAINPFQRPTNFDVPTYPPSAVRPDFGAFTTGLGALGAGIGERREQDELANIMRSATDSSGNLDLNKAATAIALSGRDPIKYLNALTARAAEQRGEAAQRALESHYKATEKSAAEMLKLRQQEVEQGKVIDFSVEDPIGVGEAKRFRRYPDGRLEQIYPPVKAPGPQSAIEPSVTQAFAFAGHAAPPGGRTEPGGNIPLQPRGPANPLAPTQAELPFDYENAPPYRVAGPPMPPPQPAQATAVTAPTNPPPTSPTPPGAAIADREAKLKQFAAEHGDQAAAVFKDVLEYKRGLPAEDKKKQGWITAARNIDPTFDPDKYALQEAEKKKGMTAEQGKAAIFANRMENSEPDIQGFTGATQGREGYVGKIADNLPFGQTMMTPDYQMYNRAKYDWISGQLRLESGAAINRDEYVKSEKTFFPQPGDDARTIAAKAEARRVETEAMKVSAGPGYKNVTKPRPVANDEEANAAIKRANQVLSTVPEGNRAAALKEVHRVLRAKNIPPSMWPQ